jgi:sortase (surface protein transpeptidase)
MALLVQSRPQRRALRQTAIFLIIFGAVLALGAVAYYVYDYKATADLDKLEVSLPPASNQGQPDTASHAENREGPLEGNGVSTAYTDLTPATGEDAVDQGARSGNIGASEDSQPVTVSISADAIDAEKTLPIDGTRPNDWDNPLEYEPLSQAEAALLRRFQPIDASDASLPGTLPPPDRLIVHAIGIDSAVTALEILDLGDRKAYETPDNVVGHIPSTSSPGELGSQWLFGHLESPIVGEGNVFHNLPKIPGLLRESEDVFAVVESGPRSYLYKLTEALVVHQDDMSLNYGRLREQKPEFALLTPTNANLHLVACVPSLVYDHRIVVSGELVGIDRIGPDFGNWVSPP